MRLDEIEQAVKASTDPGLRANYLSARSFLALAEGRLQEAYEEATRAARSDPRFAGDAARPVVLLGGYRELKDVLRGIDEATIHNKWTDCCRQMVEGALAALDGNVQQAIVSFHTAMDGWRELGTPLELALCGIGFIGLVGPAEPETVAAEAEARSILVRLGAKPFLDRLDAITAVRDPAQESRRLTPAT